MAPGITTRSRRSDVNRPACRARSVAACLLCLPILTMAAGSYSPGESHAQRAQALRESSAARAAAPLGNGYVYRDPRYRQIDYYSLMQQIRVLSGLIERMNRESNPTAANPPPMLATTGSLMGSNFDLSAYGPAGPTVESVRLLTQYQLMRLGNERLQVGTVVDQGGYIQIDVTTIDGSLVERYRVDKTTGNWSIKR